MHASQSLSLAFLICAPFIQSSLVAAEDAAETHEIFAAQPSNAVFHGLEVKGSLDDEKRWVSLKGPKFYSAPAQTKEGVLPSYLTWYEIRKPKPETSRSITLKDSFSGQTSFNVTLGDPAFFAMPAQTLGDGAPAEIPDNLNLYIAFKIRNADSVELPEPTPGKPIYVCVPAEEWHHADHFQIKAPEQFLMVYAIDAVDVSSKTTIIDQFGLNPLAIKSKDMVCVPATQVPNASK